MFVLVVALAGFTSGQHHPREERHPNFQHQVAAGVAAGSNPRHHQGPLGEIENIQLKFEGPTPVLYALPKAVPGPTDRCRFTKGGAHIITDERGNTCARSEWNPSSGCCPAAGQPPPACAALEAGTDAKLDMGDAGACEANTKCCGRYETCTACCLGQVRKLADEAKDESTDGQTRASKSLPPLSVEHSSMWNKWIESVGRDCGRIKGLPARQRPHRPVGVLCGEVPDAGFHDRARECVPPLGTLDTASASLTTRGLRRCGRTTS